MSENVKKWYVLRAIGGKEKKVKEYLETEIVRLKLQDYITQVLIPTEKIYQIRAGKKVSKERPFFPGYVIVEAAMVGEVPHVLRNIRMCLDSSERSLVNQHPSGRRRSTASLVRWTNWQPVKRR